MNKFSYYSWYLFEEVSEKEMGFENMSIKEKKYIICWLNIRGSNNFKIIGISLLIFVHYTIVGKIDSASNRN